MAYVLEKTASRDAFGKNLPINENSVWEVICRMKDEQEANLMRINLMFGLTHHYIRVRKEK